MKKEPFIVIPAHGAAYTLEDGKLKAFPVFPDTGVVDTKNPITARTPPTFAPQYDLMEDLVLMLAHINAHVENDSKPFKQTNKS